MNVVFFFNFDFLFLFCGAFALLFLLRKLRIVFSLFFVLQIKESFVCLFFRELLHISHLKTHGNVVTDMIRNEMVRSFFPICWSHFVLGWLKCEWIFILFDEVFRRIWNDNFYFDIHSVFSKVSMEKMACSWLKWRSWPQERSKRLEWVEMKRNGSDLLDLRWNFWKRHETPWNAWSCFKGVKMSRSVDCGGNSKTCFKIARNGLNGSTHTRPWGYKCFQVKSIFSIKSLLMLLIVA